MMRENAGMEEEGGTGVGGDEAGTNLVMGGGKWAVCCSIARLVP